MPTLLPHRFKPKPTASPSASLKTIVPPAAGGSTIRGGDQTVAAPSDVPEPKLPVSDAPVYGNYASSNFTLGAGVAIFHIASARVVLCYHSKRHYHFLPKGRKDLNEIATRGAEREGFEESGYRNRLLPIPLAHRQPKPYHPESQLVEPYSTEAIWTQLAPVTPTTQYILFWHIAETLPPQMEKELTEKEAASGGAYQTPIPFERGCTIKDRMACEPAGYEPVRHENTGVDEEEAQYVSSLVPIEEAIQKLGRKSVMADVVRKGWEAIQERRKRENEVIDSDSSA